VLARFLQKGLKVGSQVQGAQGDKNIFANVEFEHSAMRGRRENRCKRLRHRELGILGGIARAAAVRRLVRKSLRAEEIGAVGNASCKGEKGKGGRARSRHNPSQKKEFVPSIAVINKPSEPACRFERYYY
jgi:hypothetical protein